MPHRHRLVTVTGLATVLAAALACGRAPQTTSAGIDAPRADTSPVVTSIPSPAGPGSGEPALASAGGRAYLSWIERRGEDGEALLFATWDGATWTPPRAIAEGVPFFVNWADTPSILPMADGTLVAHWLQKAGGETYAYHVMLSWSADAGSTWSPPVSPHEDQSATEHGFVSLVDLGPGRFGAAWLDGRKYAAASGGSAETALMFAEYRDGASRGEVVLDTRVCDCCQTAAAATAAGVVVAYRDRSPEEVRDISRVVVPIEPAAAPAPNGVAAPTPVPAPAPLSREGWTIAGCPVNGPAIAASGDHVIAAWFTGERDSKRVFAAFSADGGATFRDPIRIDLGQPVGRVDVDWLAPGRALVAWIEDGTGGDAAANADNARDDAARIMGQAVDAGGRAGEPLVLATTRSARASGFPRLARVSGNLLLAWTEPGDPPHVRIVRIVTPSRPGTGPDSPARPAPRS